MKKLLAGGAAAALMFIYIVSSSDDLMSAVASYRYDNNSVLAVDKYRYGDLYGMSFLPEYKRPGDFHQLMKGLPSEITPVPFDAPRTANIYAMHDSYLYHLSDSLLCGAATVTHVSPLFPDVKVPSLDPNTKNILIIETVERRIRFFADTSWVFGQFPPPATRQDSLHTVKHAIKSWFFNPSINANLAFNFFDNIFVTPLREAKATINLHLFGRLNNAVSIAADGSYLYYRETVDTAAATSSFKPVTEEEIERITHALNAIYRHFRTIGFDQVYFSIIPNPVTIVKSEHFTYNNLIPRIQENKHLLMPTIDVFSAFMNTDAQVFFTTDSHWNRNGFQLWLNEVNRVLANNIEKSKQ
jgi:hypothetical protein